MARPIDRLLPLLGHVTHSSNESGRAACPAHGKGQKATLAWRELPDGRVLLKCFADCSVDEIVRAVGLTTADLFPERTSHTPGERFTFNARDVLRGIEFELLVVVQVARKLRNGDRPDDASWARFDLAVDRIFAGVEMSQ